MWSSSLHPCSNRNAAALLVSDVETEARVRMWLAHDTLGRCVGLMVLEPNPDS